MNLNSEKGEIAQNELKIKELAIKLETLDKETEALFKELGISPTQIAEYIDNKENFTEAEWKEIEVQKVKIEKKLQIELDNIKDPRKTKNSLSSLKTQPNWLFVR